MHDWIEIKLPNASASLSKDLDERRKLFNVDIHKAAAASVATTNVGISSATTPKWLTFSYSSVRCASDIQQNFHNLDLLKTGKKGFITVL